MNEITIEELDSAFWSGILNFDEWMRMRSFWLFMPGELDEVPESGDEGREPAGGI